jgi:hypothetical protein
MTKINFGENTADEECVLDRAKAREIVQVVLDYGINQSQMYHMIYLLALELESPENMKKITRLVKKLTSDDKPQSSLLIGEKNE